MDTTGLQFDSVCEVLYDYAELPDFIQLLQDKGRLDDVPFDASEMEMGNQVLLLTKKGFAWAILTKNRSIKFLNCFSLVAERQRRHARSLTAMCICKTVAFSYTTVAQIRDRWMMPYTPSPRISLSRMSSQSVKVMTADCSSRAGFYASRTIDRPSVPVPYFSDSRSEAFSRPARTRSSYIPRPCTSQRKCKELVSFEVVTT